MRSQTSRALLSSVALLLGVIAMSDATTQQEYCNVCSTHTMCLYTGVSNTCLAGRHESGVPAASQQEIVDVHNQLRNKVALGQETQGSPGPQPAASNMQRVAWDSELAQVAQRWADQCTFQHDTCRSVPRFYVGQNLYMTMQSPCSSVTSAQDWTRAINSWYNEVSLFDKNTVRNFQGASGVGHYTQVVWANSNLVGCGFSLYQSGNTCNKYYVCNYGPGGNYLQQAIYTTGTARSNCPSNVAADSRYPGLC